MGDDKRHIDLLLLQERCRKDPESYREEYESQQRHFHALLTSARLQPSEPSPRLAEVASFVGAVSHCYNDQHLAKVVSELVMFLSEDGPMMDGDLRRALIRLLGLLRARNAPGADPIVILPLFFRLLQCNDKNLRRILHGHVVSDIKKLAAVGHPSRRALQAFLFTTVTDPNPVVVKRGLHVLVDLFRKRIWYDAKCANMIATACFHSSFPVAIIATKFLLDSASKDEEDYEDDDDDDGNDGGKDPDANSHGRDGRKAAALWKAYNMTGKKSTKKRKRMQRVITRMTRIKATTTADAAVTDSGSGSRSGAAVAALDAMNLLNDPQNFVERLFSDLQTRRRKEPYELRLVVINLITRLVGTYRLMLFNLYAFLQRYLQPSQPEVTRVLAYLTQACHDLVPPDVLHPILRGLADTFVSERSSPPAMAAGINAIRAICARVPLAILDEENSMLPPEQQDAPLLIDLAQYKGSKDQGVVMAARSLIALYREVNPSFLPKKERGKVAAVAVHQGKAARAKAYGEHVYATGVEGVELLQEKSSEDEDDGSDEEGFESSEDNNACEKVSDDVKNGEEKSHKVPAEVTEDNDGSSENGDGNDHGELEVEDEDEDGDSGHSDCDSGTDNEDEATVSKDGSKPEKKVDELKILTDEDYRKIRARQIARSMGESNLVKNSGAAVDPDDIQGPLKRARRTLEERLESVLEGRQGREKFGSRRGLNKGGGSTNKKKLKTKTNAMVIHKRRGHAQQLGRREKQLMKRRKRDYR